MFSDIISTCLILFLSAPRLIMAAQEEPSPTPTLYEHYTAGGITSGLSANQPYFTLNNKNITIYSGAMHYFRVPRPYWRDRLRKMRAAGLNAVETYVPWNLHESQSGTFDFGRGGSDWQDFLHVEEFLTLAKEEDLFAIVRPGPYICSEWDFGGLPSWLLREKEIKVRTSDPIYMRYVKRYFESLFAILAPLQFTLGGPVIAFQVENEYGSTRSASFTPDKEYLRQLREIFLDNKIVELLVTSDSTIHSGSSGALPGVILQTDNFGDNPENNLKALKDLQPDKPLMVMEYWGGWFDHWSEQHHQVSGETFRNIYETILKCNASVNVYMFHGGTNFGFLNGANLDNEKTDNSGYQPDTTSYDYDAPLSEIGDYTEKYEIIKELLEKYNKIKTRLPEKPEIAKRAAYATIEITNQLSLGKILELHPPQSFFYENLVPMEELPINNNSGQSYGYIVYRNALLSVINPESQLQIAGHICDTVTVLYNGALISKPLKQSSDLDGFGFWRVNNATMTIPRQSVNTQNVNLDLMVENWGRVNYGLLPQFNQHKGLFQGDVYVDDKKLAPWVIFPLEFKKSWINTLDGWEEFQPDSLGPHLYKAVLELETEELTDTFIDLRDWTKGIVIINGFVLGRYSRIGPQQTLYLPATMLKRKNEILIFEHYEASGSVKFSNVPIFETV